MGRLIVSAQKAFRALSSHVDCFIVNEFEIFLSFGIVNNSCLEKLAQQRYFRAESSPNLNFMFLKSYDQLYNLVDCLLCRYFLSRMYTYIYSILYFIFIVCSFDNRTRCRNGLSVTVKGYKTTRKIKVKPFATSVCISVTHVGTCAVHHYVKSDPREKNCPCPSIVSRGRRWN